MLDHQLGYCQLDSNRAENSHQPTAYFRDLLLYGGVWRGMPPLDNQRHLLLALSALSNLKDGFPAFVLTRKALIPS